MKRLLMVLILLVAVVLGGVTLHAQSKFPQAGDVTYTLNFVMVNGTTMKVAIDFLLATGEIAELSG